MHLLAGGKGMDQVEIQVGDVRLLLSRAQAASVAAQLTQAGIGEEAQPPRLLSLRKRFQPESAGETTLAGAGRPIADDDPMWSMYSGEAKRYEGPEWGPGDERLVRVLHDRLTRYTAAFHRALVDHPGRLLSVEDLGRLTEGTDAHLSNNRVIAGAVAGYANWCQSIDRRFPFCWWEGRNGASARYAMKISVAKLFRDSRD
jgi:hypothetical protein